MAAPRQIDTDLWVVEEPLRYFVQMGRCMTVVRLAGGELWIHSPATLDDELRRALDHLGEVRFVVPASLLHGHVYMDEYASAYPEAELFAAPGLHTKRPELQFAAELGEAPDPRWSREIEQTAFRGHRDLEEIVFVHKPTRTLIVGDTAFNIEPSAPFLTRLWAWGPRMRPRVGPTTLFRLAVKDEHAARDSVERILAWDFDRVIVGHGAIIESGGKDAFAAGWSWLHRSGQAR